MYCKKKAIYFLIRDIYGKGGTEKFARTLSLCLAQAGYKIKVVTGKNWKVSGLYPHFANRVEIKLISVLHCRVLGTFWYLLMLTFYLLLRRKEYLLVQIFFLKYTALVASLVGKLLRKKIICRLSCGGRFSDVLALRRKFAGSLLVWMAKKKIDVFVVMSHAMEEELVEYGFPGEKIRLIPNGVDTDFFQPTVVKKPSQDKKILFVGRLTEQKGVEYLLQAISSIRFDRMQLVIVGEGERYSYLQKLAEHLSVRDKVIFTGFQSQILPYLQAADLFVLPSLAEGLSNALLEAMACGLPVVATRVSGNQDVIEDGVNGFLVEPKDVRGLAEAIEKILVDEKLAEKMGQANRQKIMEKYSLQVTVDRYRNLYEELLPQERQ